MVCARTFFANDDDDDDDDDDDVWACRDDVPNLPTSLPRMFMYFGWSNPHISVHSLLCRPVLTFLAVPPCPLFVAESTHSLNNANVHSG
jgi:hypothetical protein